VVDTVLDDDWLLTLVNLLTFSGSTGEVSKTFLLFLLGFWSVLVKKLEDLGSSVLI
jgi:hypothetical protein